MKKILCFLIALGVLTSCTKEEPQEKDPILLRTNYVAILAGARQTVPILSEGKFGLQSFDDNIASVSYVNPKTIIIMTQEIGETTVRVTDLNDPTRYSDIIVSSQPVDGRYIEMPPFSSPLAEIKIYIMTLVPNEALEQTIRGELNTYIGRKMFTTYDFNYDTKIVKVTMKDNAVYEGTYDWKENRLTISYNDITENYLTQYFYEGTIRIFQDVTAKYQALYPDAGIQVVEIERFLTVPKIYI